MGADRRRVLAAGPRRAGVCRAVVEVLSRLRRIASLVGGYGLSHDRADELADMVVEVIDGIKRSVVRKIAARIPAFVQMEREDILETLSSQHQAAQQFHTLVAQAVVASAESFQGEGWRVV